MNAMSQPMGNRHESRASALKILYAQDIKNELNLLTPESLQIIASETLEKIDHFAQEIIIGITNNIKEIDMVISKTSAHWKIERMSVVDRNILRIGIWELMQKQSPAIIINEAILLASEFGSENSTSFVNGILDNIKKNFPLN